MFALRPIPTFAAGGQIFLPIVSSAGSVARAAVDSTAPLVDVQFAPDTDMAQFVQDYQVTIVDAIPELASYRLQADDPTLLNRLQNDPRVTFAVADTDIRAFEAAGSDFEAMQRYFGNGGGDNNGEGQPTKEKKLVINGQKVDSSWTTWGENIIRLNLALKQASGAGVIVAVLDTGADLTHPALAGHLIPGYDFVDNDNVPMDEPNGLDDDGDGQIDEGTGHGTSVTGLIATVAPQAQIMPVRVLNSDGGGTLFAIVQGIIYAVNHGAQVINLSLSAITDSPLLSAATDYAYAHNVVVVAAAANGSSDLGYPASYASVISVGSISKDKTVSAFSQLYTNQVDVLAPGDWIYSTYTNNGYAWWSGNSMAAPFVSGEAALLISKGACVPDCVKSLIVTQITPIKSKTKNLGFIHLDIAVLALKH